MIRLRIFIITLFFAFIFSACDGSLNQPSLSGNILAANNPTSPKNPLVSRQYTTDVLLFTGTGTWSSEISSLESLLTTNSASFDALSSAQLNALTLTDLAQYGLIIFPGGSGGTEADSLLAETHANLRAAVSQSGVSYLGFCAGAFIAQAPAPFPGQDVTYGLGIVNGPLLNYYYLENQGTDIAMTLESFPDGSTEDLLYYGGPVTPNIPAGLVAKYPDGEPAISEMSVGTGLVIMSGVHPTATQAILDSLGVTSTDGTHLDLAWKLNSIRAHPDCPTEFLSGLYFFVIFL